MQRVHCVGIGGAGVQALAEWLLRCGVLVSGSDQVASSALERLERLGARVFVGHDSAQLPADADCVVYSPAVGEDNAERTAARIRGIPQYSYPQMLGRLMRGRPGIAIAGTHGKSTTTAMLGSVLTQAGLDPTVIVGAWVPQWGGCSRVGRNGPLVVEGCEFGRNFLNLQPRAVAVLNLEPDHLDYYAGLEDIVDGFSQFVERVPADGLVVANGACGAVGRALGRVSAPVQTFGLARRCTWWGADLREEEGRFRFRVFYKGDYVTQVWLQVPGVHNVLNALAAAALAHWLGVAPAVVRDGLEEFAGCARRFQHRGYWCGVSVVDDYAHHPSEVRATLTTARRVFGCRRIWCVFQPHQVSRTRALFGRFVAALGKADQVVVTRVYAARERVGRPAASALAAALADALSAAGTPARYLGELDEVTAYLRGCLKPGDVLLIMGAGDVGKVADGFARRVSRYRQAG